MDEKDLKPGIYRLSRDVQNPKADKRGKNFQRWGYRDYEWAAKMEVWPKGMRFRYVIRTGNRSKDDSEFTYPEIENFDSDMHTAVQATHMNPKWDGSADCKHPRVIANPKWVALVEALEPELESFDTFMAEVTSDSGQSRWAAWVILKELFDSGAVTQDAIRAAFAQYRTKRDDD